MGQNQINEIKLHSPEIYPLISIKKDKFDKALLQLVEENRVFLCKRKLKVTKKDQESLINNGKHYYSRIGLK